MLKICTKSGVLITGGQNLYLGEKFVDQLVACKDPLPMHLYPGNAEETRPKDTFEVKEHLRPYRWKVKEIPLETKDDMYVSTVYDIPKIENGHLFFNDMLNNGIMLFKFEEGKYAYKTFFQANDNEKNTFVQVPKHQFQQLVDNKSVYYIALSANMIDSCNLAISYSLPKILSEEIDGGLNFSIYNSPAVLIRNIHTLEPKEMIAPDFNMEQMKYFYMHFTFEMFNDKLWFGCEKLTWPMEGFDEKYISGQVDIDPFDDGFYDTFNPIMASFDVNTGKCDGHYGRLEESQRRSKTGYYFSNPVFASHGRELIYGNGYTGKLYVADSTDVENPKKCYEAFDIDLSLLPKPDDSKFYKLEYGSLYDSNFSRCVTAVKINDKEICCLVKYGKPRAFEMEADRYSFVTINRKSGKVKERFLPVVDSGSECLGYGIRNEQNSFNPFILVKEKTRCKILDLR